VEFLRVYRLPRDLLSFDLVTQSHGTLVTIADILEQLRKTGQIGKIGGTKLLPIFLIRPLNHQPCKPAGRSTQAHSSNRRSEVSSLPCVLSDCLNHALGLLPSTTDKPRHLLVLSITEKTLGKKCCDLTNGPSHLYCESCQISYAIRRSGLSPSGVRKEFQQR
jgi:hypothetical protein